MAPFDAAAMLRASLAAAAAAATATATPEAEAERRSPTEGLEVMANGSFSSCQGPRGDCTNPEQPGGSKSRPAQRGWAAALASAAARIQALQSPPDCSAARLLVVPLDRWATDSLGLPSLARRVAAALGAAALLNRTLASRPRQSPLDCSSPAAPEEWACLFEPLSACEAPPVALAHPPVPWSALRVPDATSVAANNEPPVALLAADVADERVVALDADPSMLEQRWLDLAAGPGGVRGWLCSPADCDAGSTAALAWRAALVEAVWRPLSWLRSAAAARNAAWELSVPAWRPLEPAPGRAARGVMAVALLAEPAMRPAGLSDEALGEAAVQAAEMAHAAVSGVASALLAASTDARTAAAAVAAGSWRPGVAVVPLSGAGSEHVLFGKSVATVAAVEAASRATVIVDGCWSDAARVASSLGGALGRAGPAVLRLSVCGASG